MKKSISVLAFSFLAFTFIQCSDDDIPKSCICPEIYSPVCGDDGVEYDNECEAQCAGVNYSDGFCPFDGTALVLDWGDPALDGCGWVLEIVLQDDLVGYYRPGNLAEKFKVDSLQVLIDSKLTLETSQCILSFSNTIPIIEIVSMEEL